MGQQEYEAFKAKLREWMNTHPDEYAAFEEAMNARDYAGCQSVIFQAMSLIPRYRHLMSDKANEGLFEHVDEIEQAARQHDLAGKIIRECEQPGKDSTLPAMLCWLYFGKSFERMVERCEELRRSPDLGFLQKMTMSATIKLLSRTGMPTAKRCGWPKATGCWNGLRALFRPKMRVKRGNPAGRVRPNHWWTCFHRLSRIPTCCGKRSANTSRRNTPRPTSHG